MRRAAQAPQSRPSSKCFRTCHPPPSILPFRRGRGIRARTDGRSRGGGQRTDGQTAQGSRSPTPSSSPPPPGRYCSRAAPAQPPPVARPPRAPAPTPGRGSRLRRWRRNNINTAGPPADAAPRRLPHSPGSAVHDRREAHRQTPAPSERPPQPLASVARASAPRAASPGLRRSAE